MRQTWMRLALLVAVTGVGMAKAEMVFIVETTDVLKRNTSEVLSAAELKERKKTISAEARVFQKAMELAKKEWDAAEKGEPAEKPKPGEKVEKIAALAPTPFPGGMLSPRKCRELGSFTDQEKAQKKLTQMMDAEAIQLKKAADRNGTKAQSPREIERALVAERAALALQAKIDELVSGVAAPAANGAAPAAAGGGAAAPAVAPKK